MGLNYPKDQGTEWLNLKRQVKDAFTSANKRVPYQKIAAGILKVSTVLEVLAGAYMKYTFMNGIDGIFLGSAISLNGQDAEGIIIKRNSGRTMFSSASQIDDGYGYTAVWDVDGRVVISDDADSRGLARPWIPYTFVDTADISTAVNRSTANTTDTAVVSTLTPLQHPKMQLIIYTYIQTSPATIEVKVKDLTSGSTLAAQTFSGSGYQTMTFALDPDWDYLTNHQFDVTVRRASGTGNVGATVLSWHGRQS